MLAVTLNENGISRTQCSIWFETSRWKIKDGVIGIDGDGKLSTNGTWLFVNKPHIYWMKIFLLLGD